MFKIFQKKPYKIQPFDPIKDLDNKVYREAIELLALSGDLQFLSNRKDNALVILASLDIKDRTTVPERARFKEMIRCFGDDNYREWLKTVVFH